MNKITPLALMLLGLFILPSSFAPADAVNTTFWTGLAIHGYDPVAYFTEGKAIKGKKKFSIERNGAAWRFASEKHLDLFKEDPGKYVPAYGGFCAWAVSNGDTADIDPKQWSIVDGRLFLNYNKAIQQKWQKDKEELIRKADEKWPEIRDD